MKNSFGKKRDIRKLSSFLEQDTTTLHHYWTSLSEEKGITFQPLTKCGREFPSLEDVSLHEEVCEVCIMLSLGLKKEQLNVPNIPWGRKILGDTQVRSTTPPPSQPHSPPKTSPPRKRKKTSKVVKHTNPRLISEAKLTLAKLTFKAKLQSAASEPRLTTSEPRLTTSEPRLTTSEPRLSSDLNIQPHSENEIVFKFGGCSSVWWHY
jgi:hypothetical protein